MRPGPRVGSARACGAVGRREERAFQPSTPEHMRRFISILEQAGVNATVRRSLGGDVDASCGQLRKKVKENRA